MKASYSKKNVKSLRKSTSGTKFAPIYDLTIDGGGSKTLYLRLSDKEMSNGFEEGFENIFTTRKAEADDFYNAPFFRQIFLPEIKKHTTAGACRYAYGISSIIIMTWKDG
jgi:hypothetical protein